MNTAQIIQLIGGILAINTLIWISIICWLKQRIKVIKSRMREEYDGEKAKMIIEPKSALYRGADLHFGNVKGNGVICLTENGLFFHKITGQKIEINRSEIKETIVEESFKGKISYATRGKHLIIKTMDGNQIAFLLRDAEIWSAKIMEIIITE